MTTRVAIIGAGGWGTALAITLAGSNRDVGLWVHHADLAEQIMRFRENPLYLPGPRIPESVRLTTSLSEVMYQAEIVLMAVPSHVFRSVAAELRSHVRPGMVFVSGAKGIEDQTLMRMSEVLYDVLGKAPAPRVAALSGPTFAPEVARGEPTALVVASRDEALRLDLQHKLSAPLFRLYTNADIVGVEIGAATKNIVAIAAGVAEGLGLGSNATAALVTRGLAEITRLVVACGGNRETMSGLAGIGDLVLTSYGNLSRNKRVGVALGHGRSIDSIVAGTRMIAEGIRTTRPAVELARKLQVEMPIAEKMYAVLYEGLQPRQAITELMERKLKEE